MKKLLFMLGCALVGCQPNPEPPADSPPVTLGIDYAAWPAVTPKPHRVNRELLMDCAAPSAVRVPDAERKERGPHADGAIEVRVSPDSLAQFKAAQPVPVGTAVIKLKYSSGDGPTAVAAMIKREAGYDPDGGDWEYYYDPRLSANQVVPGKIETCVECHRRARTTDYLFRTYLTPEPGKR